MRVHLIALFLFLNLVQLFSQQLLTSIESNVDCIEQAMRSVETIAFTAVFGTKLFSDTSSKERRFEVYARKNIANKGYNFDWEIIEYGEGYEFRFLFIGNEFFLVNKDRKFIGYRSNVKKLSPGDYYENMRSNTLLDELLYQFDTLYADKKSHTIFHGQSREMEVCIQIAENAERLLLIDGESCMPKSVKNIVKHDELGLTQILETKFSDLLINPILPDSILSPQYYLDQGYEVKHQIRDEERKELPRSPLSNDEISKLYETPLVSGFGDTVRLKDIDADFLLIDFWYMSCLPCLKSMPYLQALSEKYKDRRMKVIGINCYDSHNPRYVTQKLNDNGISYDNYFGDRGLVRMLRINAFPTILIIDKNRSVKYFGVGANKDLGSLLDAEIKSVD